MKTLGGSQGIKHAVYVHACPELFIVGAPRSGTTLAYKALALHPGVTYISSWLRRRPGWRWLSALNRVPAATPGLRRRYWFGEESNAYRYGARRSMAERAFPAPVEGGPVFEAAGITPDAKVATAGQAARLRQAFRSVARFGGGRTVVSKRIANNRLIPVLAEVFPEARFVNVIRDGRAVAYSLSRVNWWEEADLWWADGTPQQLRAAGKDDWELCARMWVEEVRAVRTGLSKIDGSRVTDVAYEALTASPMETVSGIARFAGLAPSEPWEAALKAVKFKDQNAAWRARLDPDVIARVEAIQAEELRRYGYL